LLSEGNAKVKDIAPLVLFSAPLIQTRIKGWMKLVQEGKFAEALNGFRSSLQSIPISVAKDAAEERQLMDMIDMCREYANFTRLEVSRKSLAPSEVGRAVELNAYMTCCKVHPQHLMMALRLAMATSFKAENYVTAASFSKRLLQGIFPGNTEQVLTSARQVEKVCEQKASDAHNIRFDVRAPVENFKLCSGSFTPIAATDTTVQCPYCGAFYHAGYKGKLCDVCQLSEIGANTLGIQLRPI